MSPTSCDFDRRHAEIAVLQRFSKKVCQEILKVEFEEDMLAILDLIH